MDKSKYPGLLNASIEHFRKKPQVRDERGQGPPKHVGASVKERMVDGCRQEKVPFALPGQVVDDYTYKLLIIEDTVRR